MKENSVHPVFQPLLSHLKCRATDIGFLLLPVCAANALEMVLQTAEAPHFLSRILMRYCRRSGVIGVLFPACSSLFGMLEKMPRH